MTDLKLFTGSWSSLHQASRIGPLPVVPVRTSNSAPKFWPAAAGSPACDELTPPKWIAFGKLDREKARKGYRRGLHLAGVDRITARLCQIAEQHEGRPLVLLCFEKDRADCHRLWFAQWWEKQTGVVVPELAVLRGREGTWALVREVEAGAATPPSDLSNGGLADPATGQKDDGHLAAAEPAQLRLGEGL